MPHVIVKLLAGRSEKQKLRIANDVATAVMAGAECPETAVSVSIEDVEQDRWADDVYTPDIVGNWDKVYKKPGYKLA